MQGYIKLHRCLLEKPIWRQSSPEHCKILVTLLLMANHEENEWWWKENKYNCEPGQFVTSLKSISEISGTSIQNVRSALVKFEKLEFLTNESTRTGRLITIINWKKYQAKDKKANKVVNKEVTKHQQSTNKALTSNKNDKNDKNDKNYITTAKKISYAEFVSMTPEEYQKLLDRFGEDHTKRMVEILDNYKGSKDVRYKSDYRAILNWVVKRYEEENQNQRPSGIQRPKGWTVV